MGHELKAREIFATGVWNDMDFTVEDLNDIVDNFEKLKDKHFVPLKFGHGPDHEDDKDIMGQPAIGWISRIFRQGEKLFADFSDLPQTVFDVIKNKLYRTVSIELLFNVENDGNKFNHVLDAVALLGTDHPAVNSLADLDALLATRTRFTGGHRVAFETTAGKGKTVVTKIVKKEFELDEKDVKKMVDTAIEPLKDANTKLTKDLEAANKVNAQFIADKADAEKKATEEAVKLARKDVTEVLDAAVRLKTLTPALRETYELQIGVNDDERVVKIKLDEVKAMFKVPEDTKQTGLHKSVEDEDEDDDADPEAKLMALTYKNMAENGKDNFRACFMRIAKANPKLHKAYLDANGIKGRND